MLRGKSVKLLPTKEQEQLFIQFSGARRFAYNWALSKEIAAFENHEKFISVNELCREIVILKKTDDDFKWLLDISCDVVKQAIKDLGNAYSRFFSMQKKKGYQRFTKNTIKHSQITGKKLTSYDMNGHPKYKKKSNCQHSFHLDCMQVKFRNNYAFIQKIGFVRIANSNLFPQGKSGKDFKIANAKVKFDGKYWILCGAVETNVEKLTYDKTESLGIDLGLKDTAILSNGIKYKNINKTQKVKKLEKRKKRLQKQCSRKYEMNNKNKSYRKTHNIVKLEKQIRSVDRKLSNIRKDYRHQITTQIVKRNPIFICVEDLNVEGMKRNKHLSKSISDQGLGYILSYFEYKCDQYDIPLYKADRFYPSSKTCSCCGNIKSDLKLSDRAYKCSICGTVIDRDINAAINLREYGQQIFNKSINQAS